MDIKQMGLYQVSDNDYIKNIMAHDKETFLVAIMTKAFDGFKAEVLQKIQYIKDVNLTTNAVPVKENAKKSGFQRKPIMSSGKPISMHNEEKDKGNIQDIKEKSMEIDK